MKQKITVNTGSFQKFRKMKPKGMTDDKFLSECLDAREAAVKGAKWTDPAKDTIKAAADYCKGAEITPQVWPEALKALDNMAEGKDSDSLDLKVIREAIEIVKTIEKAIDFTPVKLGLEAVDVILERCYKEKEITSSVDKVESLVKKFKIAEGSGHTRSMANCLSEINKIIL